MDRKTFKLRGLLYESRVYPITKAQWIMMVRLLALFRLFIGCYRFPRTDPILTKMTKAPVQPSSLCPAGL